MGKTKFKMLEIEMPLPWKMVYHDDGFQDVYGHLRELDIKYNGKTKLADLVGAEPIVLGRFVQYRTKLKAHGHIWYRDTDKFYNEKGVFSDLNARTRAHEETHALYFFGGIALLSEAIEKAHGLIMDFDKIKDEEIIAEIGAIYVLKRRGTLDKFSPKPIDSEHFKRAKEIFENAL